MTIKFRSPLAIVICCYFNLAADCISKPLDVVASANVLILAKLAPVIGRGVQLTFEQWSMIERALASQDDISVALAALFLRELATPEADSKLNEINLEEIQPSALSTAVVLVSRDQIQMRSLPNNDQIQHWLKLTEAPDAYVRIEAAKMLAKVDPSLAANVLLRLEDEKSDISASANRMRRDFARATESKLPAPVPDFAGSYEMLEHFSGKLSDPPWEKLLPKIHTSLLGQ